MTAHLLAMTLALASQVGGRYGDAAPTGTDSTADSTPAASDAGSETAAADDSPGLSTITLPGSPAPTLGDEPASGEPAVAAPPAAAPTTEPATGGLTPEEAEAAAVFSAPATASGAAAPTTTGAATEGAATQPPAAAAESSILTTGPKPAELMRQLATVPQTGQLPGVALSLGEAMQGAANRVAQTERIKAYWDLSAAVTQYYLAMRESLQLAALRQGIAKPAVAEWDAAAADLAKRVEATRQGATAAQLRLHRLMGAAASATLPLPADVPHCGRYNTRYDEIFTTHLDQGARQLNTLIPLLHAELATQMRQVADVDAWLDHVSETRLPENDGVGLLRSFQLAALLRREFVESARQYNHHIAAYSELAAPEQIGPERLVAMLIRVSNPASAATSAGGAVDDGASGVEPATATEPVEEPPQDEPSASRNNGLRRTFARRPFERLRNREHSILIRPLRGLLGRKRTPTEQP